MILREEHFLFTYVKQKCTIFFIPFQAKQAMIKYYVNIITLKKNSKRGFNIEIVHTCTKAFGHWTKFIWWRWEEIPPNVYTCWKCPHNLTGTPECLATVYPTIETAGGNPVRLVISLAFNTGEGNLVWSWGGFVGNRAFFMGFASSNLVISLCQNLIKEEPAWNWYADFSMLHFLHALWLALAIQ